LQKYQLFFISFHFIRKNVKNISWQLWHEIMGVKTRFGFTLESRRLHA